MNNNKQKTATILLSVGMIILLITAVLPIIGVNMPWIKYIYAGGAIFTLISHTLNKYNGKNFTLKRLYRIQAVSSICYCISAATLCIPLGSYISEKDWLAFLMAGAVLQIYSSWRIQSEESKESGTNCKKQ